MWKSRTLFAVTCAAVLGFAALFDDTSITFLLLYALAILLLSAAATILAAPLFVRLEEEVEGDTAFKQEPLAYRLAVVNRSVFFYPRVDYVFYNDQLVDYTGGNAPAGSLAPRAKVGREYRLRFPYRGVYEVGIQSAVVTDFLGLFRIALPVPPPRKVWVYPESDEGFTLALRKEQQGTALNSDLFNEDYTAVADVRRYEHSDSLKKVHWKLSAKHLELLVKNFQTFEPNRTKLLLDTVRLPLAERERAAVEDRMVAYVAAAVGYCMQGRLPADLIYGSGARDQVVVDPADDLEKSYRLLAEIAFLGETTTLAGHVQAMDITGEPFNIVVFVPGMAAGAYGVLTQLLSFGHSVLLYSFYSPGWPEGGETQQAEERLESLRASGAAVNRVPVEPEPAG